MKKTLVLGLLLAGCAHKEVSVTREAPPAPMPAKISMASMLAAPAAVDGKIGQNIGGFDDWSPNIIFADIFKQMRQMWAANTTVFGAQGELPVDKNGWPLEVPFTNAVASGLIARSGMFGGTFPKTLPTGLYTLYLEGDGEVCFQQDISGCFTAPGRYPINVPSITYAFWFQMTRSNKSNPVRVRLMMPGYDPITDKDAFYKPYLDTLKGWSVLRTMDLQITNGSAVKAWADVKTKAYATQTSNYEGQGQGQLAPEYLVDLANAAGTDLWINIPQAAENDYVFQFATLVKNKLNPLKKVYVEWSNEVWNSGFTSHQYAFQKAKDVGLGDGSDWRILLDYQMKRSLEIFQIFNCVFAGQEDRIVKVIGSQAASAGISTYLLESLSNPKVNPKNMKVDALAIAPYFGYSVAPQICVANEMDTITPLQIVQRSVAEMHTDAFEWIKANKAVAQAKGVRLIAYEAGQHIVGAPPGCRDNPILVPKLMAAQRLPEMGLAYKEYLEFWQSQVGDVMTHFNDMGVWGQYGNWGASEYVGDLTPKIDALMKAQGLGGGSEPPSCVNLK